MSLDNLFIEGPQFSETSLIKLPQDIATWQENIIAFVKQQFPMLDSMPMNVSIKSLNEDSATAIGSVAITHPILKKTAYIPVIVKNGMMYPLDVWQDDKQTVRPITDETFEAYFFNDKIFEALDKRPADPLGQYFNDPSLWQTTYPPLQGRYAYASVSGALLGQILEDATEEDLKRFATTLEKEPGALLLFSKNENLDLIKKVAAMKPKPKPPALAQPTMNQQEGKLPLSPVYVAVRKDPLGTYNVLAVSDKHFVTKAQGIARQNVSSYIGTAGCKDDIRTSKLTLHPEQFMNDVDHSGERTTDWIYPPQDSVMLQDDMSVDAVKATKFGMYRVRRMSDGVTEKGMVFPVIDYDQNATGTYVFLGGTNSCMPQASIVGIPVPTMEDMKTRIHELCESTPSAGQVGTFIYVDKEAGLATEPVQIVRIESHWGAPKIRAMDFKGNVFYICKDSWSGSSGHEVQRITKTPENDHNLAEVRLPPKMRWVPMEGFKSVSGSKGQFFEKIAAKADEVRIRWTGINFEMKGNGIEKNAAGFDCKDLDTYETRFLCRALGATTELTDKIIKTAKIHGAATVTGLLAPQPQPEFQKAANVIHLNVRKAVDGLRTDLIKEASAVPDMATVDAILSLNFINPDNIQKFVEALPVLTKAHFKLAELVLASRLGLEAVPHDPLVVCMKRMTDVLKGLKALDQSLSDLSKKSKAKQQVAAMDNAQGYVGT